MRFLRIEDYVQSAGEIGFYYSNSPFSMLLVAGLVILCVVIAVHRTRSRKWLKTEREKIAIEFGVPVFCIFVAVTLSYGQEDLVGKKGSPELVQSSRIPIMLQRVSTTAFEK